MLYAALVFSAVLLAAVNIAALVRPSRPVLAVAGLGLAASLMTPFVCMVFLPVVALQAALLCVAGPVWRWSGRGIGRFAAASVGVTVVAYTVVGVSVARTEAGVARLRDRFPYQSMEGRVPHLPARPGQDPPFDPRELGIMEDQVEQAVRSSRRFQLEHLHEHNVQHFVNSFGFGVGRMARPRPLTEEEVDPPPPQPAEQDPSSVPPLGVPPGVPTPDSAALGGLHFDGVLDFVRPRGFGYVKDRRNVAGFQSHGFTKVPEGGSALRWEVARVDLVGLLRHPGPVVYLSDKLPQMDALKGAPTRPLDPFEAEGLEALRKGGELHVRGHRMLGAVRATKQCLDCHGGNRGDLLGAFSYTLRPVTRKGE
jgi:hypothetical protein